MATISRRQLLLGGGALAGATMVPSFVQQAVAQEIPRPAQMVRAGSNENPYGPSRVALQAIADTIKMSNKYGAGYRRELMDLVGSQNGVTPEQMVLSSGSGEILKVGGLLASWEEGSSIVCADPTFQDLVRYAGNSGAEIIRVPVRNDLSVDLEAIASAIRPDTVMVYLVNPNNPTPTLIYYDELRAFVEEVSKDRMVFVDEAYYEYVDDPNYGSMIDLVAEGVDNLIVSRTASKIHGLAGLRVGFGFAHPDLATRMNQVKTGGMNHLGVAAAYASYQDMEFQDFTRLKNRESMAIVEDMLEELGVRYVKSPTNFTFFETGIPVDELNAELRANGIISGRPFPPYLTWSRISMQTPEEMRYYVQTFKRLFGNRILDAAA